MGLTPGRLIGWALAAILVAIAAGCILTVLGVSYEVMRGVVH